MRLDPSFSPLFAGSSTDGAYLALKRLSPFVWRGSSTEASSALFTDVTYSAMAKTLKSPRHFHLPREQPDRGIVERMWVEHFLKGARFRVHNLIALKQDPPDCEALVDGLSAGIEATELIDEKTAKSHDHWMRHLEYSRSTFHEALQAAITKKDKKHWAGGSYDLRLLVVYTNELYLPRDKVKAWLAGRRFQTREFDHVVFGLSYHPETKRLRPAFRLRLVKAISSAK